MGFLTVGVTQMTPKSTKLHNYTMSILVSVSISTKYEIKVFGVYKLNSSNVGNR